MDRFLKYSDQQGQPIVIDQGKVRITKGDPVHDLGISGLVVGYPEYSFNAKVFDHGSRFGINGGRISKLSIKHRGEIVVEYSRGWPVGARPRTKTPEQRAVLQQILQGFPERRSLQQKVMSMRNNIRDVVSDYKNQVTEQQISSGKRQRLTIQTAKKANGAMEFFQKRETSKARHNVERER